MEVRDMKLKRLCRQAAWPKGTLIFSWDGAASGETGRAVSYMACSMDDGS